MQVFGDVVLHISPGGTSDLLSKPKPWRNLSARGRDCYLKMNDWLNDPDGVSKVQKASLTMFSGIDEESRRSPSTQSKSSIQKRKAVYAEECEQPKKAQVCLFSNAIS